LAFARTDAGGVCTAAELLTLAEGKLRLAVGSARLAVVIGRLTRPLGTGTLRDGAEKRDEPLGLVKVRGVTLGMPGVVVIVDPRNVEGRLYVAA
jgi:hypothetical protein